MALLVVGHLGGKGAHRLVAGLVRGQASPVEIATLLTTTNGVWDTVVKPTLLTTYQAHWKTTVSQQIVNVLQAVVRY